MKYYRAYAMQAQVTSKQSPLHLLKMDVENRTQLGGPQIQSSIHHFPQGESWPCYQAALNFNFLVFQLG